MNGTTEEKVTAFPGSRAWNALRASLCWPRDTLLPLEVLRRQAEEDASKDAAA